MFLKTEPIGEERMDYRMGTIAALFANANRRPGSAAFEMADFTYLPELRREHEDAIVGESLEDIARAWGALH